MKKVKMVRKPKDRDFLETKEGMFFCVTGYLHPPDRITAYLKYSPAEEGKWKKDRLSFRRELPYYHVSSVSSTIDYLKKNYPQYVSFCPVRQIEMSMVPNNCIKAYYEPEKRMNHLFYSPEDELEEKARALAQDIMDETLISLDSLGITGSILIGLHNPLFSDIDLIVYGREPSLKVKKRLKNSAETLTGERREEWISHRMKVFHLTRKEAERVASRKWNYGFYKNTYFSIHPTRTDSEITESYGDFHYTGMGAATVKAEICDSSESMFLPALYRIEVLEITEGENVPVKELISYETVYCDAFEEGERIEARGKLEKVNGQYRLVLGALQLRDQYIHFL